MGYILSAKLGAGLLALGLLAGTAGGQEWSFTGVDRVEFRGASGDVTVRPSADGKTQVKLQVHVEPADAFEPRVEQSGSALRIDEHWHGNGSSGGVQWTLLVPAKDPSFRIGMDTASGDLDVEGITARIDLDAASGDIALRDVRLGNSSDLSTASGDFVLRGVTLGDNCEIGTASGDVELTGVNLGSGCEISTASGDVEATDCKGSMELSAASGDVVVKKCDLAERGEFSTASGDVTVQLAKLPSDELSASSASGDVSLDVADFGANFTLTLVKRQNRGRFVCPFEYTAERTFEERHVYEEKVVKRGTGGPDIELRTDSGSVTVRK